MHKKNLALSLAFACFFMVACNVGDNPESGVAVVEIPQEEYAYYYEHYLSAWGFYSPFERDFNEETFAEDFHPYLLFSSGMHQESRWEAFEEGYEDWGVIPADYVELVVTRHFPITAEQYRAALPKTENAWEYYDSENSTYHFEGGYGGVGLYGEIHYASREGNILVLSCSWYDEYDNSYAFTHTVTIKLGETDLDFYYMENARVYGEG